MTMDFHRQLDIVDSAKLGNLPFILIGAGGIGSPLALILVKMGVRNLTVYDPDVVEAHNLPSQQYRVEDIGRPKVEALAAICQQFAGVSITAKHQTFDSSEPLSGVVISAVDSMATRREIWEQGVRYNPMVKFYLEARMGAQEGRIYTLKPCNPDHVDSYEKTLYSDEESVELPCTARAIGYNTAFLGGLMASQVQKLIMNQPVHSALLFDLVSLMLVKLHQQERMQ